jgi:hypothetical protein
VVVLEVDEVASRHCGRAAANDPCACRLSNPLSTATGAGAD